MAPVISIGYVVAWCRRAEFDATGRVVVGDEGDEAVAEVADSVKKEQRFPVAGGCGKRARYLVQHVRGARRHQAKNREAPHR